MNNSIATIAGLKVITSRYLTEIKVDVVPVHVPRRGITINRKVPIEVPYEGFIIANGSVLCHPACEQAMWEKVAEAMFGDKR